nr:hypothetical protein [Tanacetum cinerariifolium]
MLEQSDRVARVMKDTLGPGSMMMEQCILRRRSNASSGCKEQCLPRRLRGAMSPQEVRNNVSSGGGAMSSHKVKYKYVTRNTGNGRKNEDNTDSYETLRCNAYDSVMP